MNGPVVHTLFGLFHECFPKDFPGQVFGNAIDLFEGLIDGNLPFL